MTNIIRLAAAAFVVSTLGPVHSSDMLKTKRDQNGRWIVLKTGEDIASKECADEHINASLLAYYMEKFPGKFEDVETTTKRNKRRLSVAENLRELEVDQSGIFKDNHKWGDDKSMSNVMRNTGEVVVNDETGEHWLYSINFIGRNSQYSLFYRPFSVKIENLNRFIAECGESIVADHEALVADHEALKSVNESLNKKCKEVTIERDEFEKEIERLKAEMNRMREENEGLRQSLDCSSVSGRCISPEPCEPENCPEGEESTNY